MGRTHVGKNGTGSDKSVVTGNWDQRMQTIIVVLWKYRLNLSKIRKPNNVRIYVVGPPRLLYDETNVDVYYQVVPPVKDHDRTQLLQKVRELTMIFASTERHLVVFEADLQKEVSQIRKELDVDGYLPDQLEQVLHMRDYSAKRGALASLSCKQCSLSGSPQPDQWLESVRSQVGGFPAIVRPVKPHCAHSVGIVRNEGEFKAWFRRASNVNKVEEYIVEEYMNKGYDFTVVCTAQRGMIACIPTIDTKKTILECIQNQLPYALELLDVDQTRDIMPGVESFIIQVTKSVFAKNYAGVLFIKGFYKNHNDIFFLGFTLEPESETIRTLLATPGAGTCWEALSIESYYEKYLDTDKRKTPKPFHCIINFPMAEGVLIHQTTISKKLSDMRVSWRVAEGDEMTDSDSMDDNAVQVFVSNTDRDQMLADVRAVMRDVDVTIDRNVLLERHSICRRNVARLNPKELIRSCTTAD